MTNWVERSKRPVWRIGEIYPSDWVEVPREWLAIENPRRGKIEVIKGSIRSHGFFRRLVLQAHSEQQGGPRIIAGNHSWQAGNELGMTHFPLEVWDVTDEEGDKILIIDNRSQDVADWELRELVPKLQSFDSLDGTGFTALDLEIMLAELHAPEPPEEQPRGTGLGDMIQVKIGEIAFVVDRDHYEDWIATLRYEAGVDLQDAVQLVRERLEI